MSYRRRHLKIEKLEKEHPGLQDMVDEMLSTAGVRYLDIQEAIAEKYGARISINAIFKYAKSWSRMRQEVRENIKEAQKLIEATGNSSGLELSEVSSKILLGRVLEKLAEMGRHVKLNDLRELVKMVSFLETAASKREGVKLRQGKAFKAFERRVAERLRKEVGKDKELAARLEAIIADEAEQIAKEAA